MKLLMPLVASLLVGCGEADHSDSGDPLDWLRDSVPGEPGVDYPVLAEVQDTSFSCQGRVFGGENDLWSLGHGHYFFSATAH